jgi:GTP cyclohydrolase II
VDSVGSKLKRLPTFTRRHHRERQKELEMHVPNRVIRPQPTEGRVATWLASSPLPTKHGPFQTHVFRSVANQDGGEPGEKEHVALVHGELQGRSGVPIRVHSECITSEVFGSLKCDCKEQLDAAMAEVVRRGGGAVLYLRQEGRGIGLANKIRAYHLQSQGADTVDANRLLGLPDDARRYDVVRYMLEHLGVESVRLMTNNPAKIDGLRRLGVQVVGTIPVVVQPNEHSLGYLETKRVRMAHSLPVRALDATGSDGE